MPNRVVEMIVVVRVLAPLFFLTLRSGAPVRGAQVRRPARIRSSSASRKQALHVPGSARRADGRLKVSTPMETFKLLFALGAFVLENRHLSRRDPQPIVPP